MKTLSTSLLNEIRVEIIKSGSPKMTWADNYKLSMDDITGILFTPEGVEKFKEKFKQRKRIEIQLCMQTHIKNILQNFEEELSSALAVAKENIKIYLDTIISRYNLFEPCAEVNINFEQLLKNTSPKIGLVLGHSHKGYDENPEDPITYSDAEEMLSLFNINPYAISEDFPQHPERDGNEYILLEDWKKLWNSCRRGTYIVTTNIDISDYVQKAVQYHTAITLLKGCEIQIHNIRKHISSIPVPIQKDLTILNASLDYTFFDSRVEPNFSKPSPGTNLHSQSWKNPVVPVTSNTSAS